MNIKFANFAKSTIADVGGIGSGDLTLNVQSGDGNAYFPALAANQYFYCVLVDVSGNREVIKVTARSGDAFTIVRAQDGTSARAFSQDDKVSLALTKGALDEITEAIGELNDGSGNLDCDGNADILGSLDIGAGTTRRVSVGGTAVNAADGGPYISSTTFDVTTDVAAATWESIGPTGGGANNTWAALDSVPLDADYIVIDIQAYGRCQAETAGLSYAAYMYARKNGGSVDETDETDICYFSSVGDPSGNCKSTASRYVKIPVSAANLFDLYWTSTFTTNSIVIKLVEWGFNP